MKTFPKITLSLFSLLSAVAIVPAHAAVTNYEFGNFSVDFYNSGDSFNWGSSITSSSDWTGEQITQSERAFDYWNNLVVKAGNTRDIKIAVAWGSLGGSVLGQTGMMTGVNNGKMITAVEGIWRDGINYFNSGYDFMIQFSTDFSFSFSGSPTYSQTDFYSVFLHEIGHNFGFMSSATSTGWGGDGGLPPTAFDSLMLDNSGGGAIDSAYAPGNPYSLGDTGLLVYNPASWSGGSSMSHVTGGDGTELMQYSIGRGEVRDGLSARELSLMTAMGWTLAIPEPSMFAFLAGLGTLVFTVSRRRCLRKINRN